MNNLDEAIELGSAVRVVFRPHPDMGKNVDDAVNPTNDPVNDPVNDRQKWYLEQLVGGVKAKATDLALHWSVSPVTAKRDIADLKQRGLIEFVSSAKTGEIGGQDDIIQRRNRQYLFNRLR